MSDFIINGSIVQNSDSEEFTYDATAEFSFVANPNGVWSYGYRSLAIEDFSIYNTTRTTSNPPGQLKDYLKDNAVEPAGLVGKNDSPTFWPSYGGIPAWSLYLHPSDLNPIACLRWQAPMDFATVNISGQYLGGDTGAVYGIILRGNAVIYLVLNPGIFDIDEISVTSGESIYIGLSGGAGFFGGTTPFSAIITATT